jgi:peptide/nickel transport system permease protein
MPETPKESKLSFTLKRTAGFLSALIHNKRALLGLGILVFYSAIALGAPLLTKNDPVFGRYVSGDYAVPMWFKLLPGGENVIPDTNPVNDPGFNSPDSLLGDQREWNFTAPTQGATVSLQYSPDIGRPASQSGSGPGSASIVFNRNDKTKPAGEVTAILTKDFYYPNEISPRRFSANISADIIGADKIPVTIKLFVANATGFKTFLWVSQTISVNETITWIVPETPVDSYNSAVKEKLETQFGRVGIDPAKVLFPTKSDYTLGVEIVFSDATTGIIGPQARVYIDDMNLRLFGNGYGLLGTDHMGRDIFSQLIYGARISLFVGLLSAVLSVGLGLLIGLIAGYSAGALDEVIMRLTDALLVLPGLPLLLVLIALLGPSIWNLIMVIGVLGWMGFARTVRSQTLSIKERPFVEAAKAIGAGRWHIILRHILPNVMTLVYVSLALAVPSAILSEAALSFLGLFDPTVVSWGRMLNEAEFNQGIEKWWWIVPPGVSIALVSLSFILIGYALDELLNPKLRQRR